MAIFLGVAAFSAVDVIAALVQRPAIKDKECPLPKEALVHNIAGAVFAAIGSFPEKPSLYGKDAEEIAKAHFKTIAYDNPAKVAKCYVLPSTLLVKAMQHLRGS